MNKRGRGLFIASFLAPAVLIYAGLVVYPMIQSFQMSAYRWRGLSMNRTFVGTKNFRDLTEDEVFRTALTNNLTLLLVGGTIILLLSIAVAHGLQQRNLVSRTLKSVVLFPQMISLVAVATLWMFVFNPTSGLLTPLMKGIGLDGWVHTWLGERLTAHGAVGVAFVWYSVGFYIMLFAAGLKAIPEELNEAASLDGAIGLKRFWKVTWPMLWSVKRIAIVHLTIGVVNVFVLVFLMTAGGPDRGTEVMLTYLYENAFRESQFGYATAIAVVNFVLIMVVATAILLAFRRDPTAARTRS